LKRSDIRELVLETLLEFERAKGNASAPKPKKAKAGKKKAKAKKADKPVDIPAFLPKISDETLLRASAAPKRQTFNPFKFAVPPPGVLPEGVPAPSMAGGEQLFKRMVLFNSNRDSQGLVVLDKETEEYFNVSTLLTTLDQCRRKPRSTWRV
jgi:hypothetical protein